MKEGSPVAVLTVGGERVLNFHRKYEEDGKMLMEKEACMSLLQEEGSVFLLHPDDEKPKCRRNRHGKRMKSAVFSHGIICPRDMDYFSVAFIFRCVETTAIVNTTTDRVVPPPPVTVADHQRRLERQKIRARDNKARSEFKREVAKVQQEWLRLMKLKNW